MNSLNKILFFLFFLFFSNAKAQNIKIEDLINKAASQRAISQRMAKDYMLIGLGIRVDEHLKDLDESSAVFNENLHTILFENKSKKAEEAVNVVKELWSGYREVINETPKKENITKVYLASTNLMNACNAVLDVLINDNNIDKKDNLHLIARCGSQRKNSQRMAMLYAAKAWDINTKIDDELKNIVTEIELTLDYLLKNPSNTQGINEILKFHRDEWILLRKTFDVSTGVLKPEQVSSSAKLIFKDFDTLTKMYEKLSS